MLLLRSRKNCVRGNGSCSGSQSASRTRVRCSKRLGGLLPAPRAGGDGRPTVTGGNVNGEGRLGKSRAAALAFRARGLKSRPLGTAVCAVFVLAFRGLQDMSGYSPTIPAIYRWLDLPASYHGNAGGLSFADGHSEIHRWRDAAPRARLARAA